MFLDDRLQERNEKLNKQFFLSARDRKFRYVRRQLLLQILSQTCVEMCETKSQVLPGPEPN